MQMLEEILIKEGKCIFPIKGISMMPMLEQSKDTVLVVITKDKLKKYDIPLYKVKGNYYLHRIISVKNDYYITCGDNCITKERVPFSNVLGVVEGFYKNGKYISCSNSDYLKYAKKRCKSRWRRSLVRYISYGAKRIFGRNKKQ